MRKGITRSIVTAVLLFAIAGGTRAPAKDSSEQRAKPQRDIPALYSATKAGCLRILLRSRNPDGISELVSLGSGFWVGRNLAVTACHVVEGRTSESLIVETIGSRQFQVEGYRIHKGIDLALLKVAIPSAPPYTPVVLPLADEKDTLQIGQEAMILGYPWGYRPETTSTRRPFLTMGYLSGEQETQDPIEKKARRLMLIAVNVNPGNSGGPVISVESGRVIGVVLAKTHPFPEAVQGDIELLRTAQGEKLLTVDETGKKNEIPLGVPLGRVLDFLNKDRQPGIAVVINAGIVRNFLNVAIPVLDKRHDGVR